MKYLNETLCDSVCQEYRIRDGKKHARIIAGPTCESIDIAAENIMIPNFEIGDLVIGHQGSAYSAATKTRFNSLPDAKLVLEKSI